jgi:hypothetical protein
MGLRKRKVRAMQRVHTIARLPPRCNIQIKEHGNNVLSFNGDIRSGLKEFATMCLDVYGIEITTILPKRDLKKEEEEYLEAKKCENQQANGA